MPTTSSGNATFWRGCCLTIAAIAAVEALCLVFMAHPPQTSPPVASSQATRPLPDATPAAATATQAATDEEAAHLRRRASSRTHALATRDPRQRARELEDRGISLAEKDPEAASRALAELAPGADRNAMTRGVFEVLARGDAAQAIAYARQTQPGLQREAALSTLLESWNGPGDDSLPSARARLIASAGLEAGLGRELLQGDSPRPDLAALWAQELTSGKGKTDLLGAAAAAQVRTDPALAASYGDGLVGKDQLAFNEDLVSSWSRTQPDAAWQWSSALADPAARVQAQNAVIEAQSQNDPQGAIARLALLPGDGLLPETLREVAAHYASGNTDAAIAWAQTLPPAESAVANEGISLAAPVGVGMMVSQDADGRAVVQGLLPNMGAAQSGAIHEGDRIVAVDQGNNQFVDVQQLGLDKVVGLIRGPAGSTVQLQVAPALPGGEFGTPTVVTIVRQQISMAVDIIGVCGGQSGEGANTVRNRYRSSVQQMGSSPHGRPSRSGPEFCVRLLPSGATFARRCALLCRRIVAFP